MDGTGMGSKTFAPAKVQQKNDICKIIFGKRGKKSTIPFAKYITEPARE